MSILPSSGILPLGVVRGLGGRTSALPWCQTRPEPTTSCLCRKSWPRDSLPSKGPRPPPPPKLWLLGVGAAWAQSLIGGGGAYQGVWVGTWRVFIAAMIWWGGGGSPSGAEVGRVLGGGIWPAGAEIRGCWGGGPGLRVSVQLGLADPRGSLAHLPSPSHPPRPVTEPVCRGAGGCLPAGGPRRAEPLPQLPA